MDEFINTTAIAVSAVGPIFSHDGQEQMSGTSPIEITAVENSTVTIYCNVTASNPMVTSLTLTTNSSANNVSFDNSTGAITIMDFTVDNEGIYTCTADNGVTTPTNISFVLVLASPSPTSSVLMTTPGPTTSVLPSTTTTVMSQVSSTQVLQASPTQASQASPTPDSARAFNISFTVHEFFHCCILFSRCRKYAGSHCGNCPHIPVCSLAFLMPQAPLVCVCVCVYFSSKHHSFSVFFIDISCSVFFADY